KENEELREELKRLEGVEDYVLSIERDNKSLRKLLNEKETVCEHDWQPEWVKSYITSDGGQKVRCRKCLIVKWIYD
ncbi:hypothetical protein LCGC14_2115750, partial [marine sediment metagenome]